MLASPRRLVGMALHIQAEAAAPRLAPEQGVHVLVSPKLPQPARTLVESREAVLASYVPPAGVRRRGAVADANRRRLYDRGKEVVEDAQLGTRTAWQNRSLADVIAGGVEDHLRKQLLRLLDE